MTNNEVKAFLRQYRTCMAKAQRLKADMEIFTASAKSIKGEFDECINRSAKIEKLISSHKNYLEREILIRKYIYGDTTEEIAERLNYSPRHIQRIGDRAVQNFGNSLEM